MLHTQGMAQLQAGRPAKAASPSTALLIIAALAMLSSSLASPSDMPPSVKAREDMRLRNHLSSYHRNRAARTSPEHQEQASSDVDPHVRRASCRDGALGGASAGPCYSPGLGRHMSIFPIPALPCISMGWGEWESFLLAPPKLPPS